MQVLESYTTSFADTIQQSTPQPRDDGQKTPCLHAELLLSLLNHSLGNAVLTSTASACVAFFGEASGFRLVCLGFALRDLGSQASGKPHSDPSTAGLHRSACVEELNLPRFWLRALKLQE